MTSDLSVLSELSKKFSGVTVSEIYPLKSHGSDRRIFRIYLSDENTLIGIANDNIAENKAFIGFADHFKRHGMNVPEIFSVSEDLKHYLLEDLGDITLLNEVSKGFDKNKITLYKEAIDNLIKFQIEASSDINYSLCYQFREFGEDNMRFDLNYFRTSFLDNYRINYNDELLEMDFRTLIDILMNYRRDYFLYRDFQSRNIMIKDDSLYFIDFQSGRKGALLYDIASLLYDSKANIPQYIREELLEYYFNKVSEVTSLDINTYRYGFWYFVLVRILQAMGAYGYLGFIKGKREFLESVHPALLNVRFVLSEKIKSPELKYLETLFNEKSFHLN
ncbi:MAG: phosphotransferase [Ignavibacteria bacterium]|nr:phosphotransferase [Ignavibacteria bacterium]